jgi:hypothetical protein
MKKQLLLMLLGMGFRAFSGQIGLRVPAFTAYLEPNNETTQSRNRA